MCKFCFLVALFFGTYDASKLAMEKWAGTNSNPFIHMAAASFGEVVSENLPK
jgi:hypothetical protein